jgi:hypothetical protein
MPTSDEPKKEKSSSEGKKKGSSNAFENLKKNEKIDHIIKYAQSNTQDTIAFALLLLGILWSLFHGFYGGVLVGLVAGFYFSREILELIKSYNDFVKEQGTPRTLILGGTLLALFIAAPGFFVGLAIMVGLKIMLRTD